MSGELPEMQQAAKLLGLGHEVALGSRVSTDPFGRGIVIGFEDARIRVRLDKPLPSGQVDVLVRPTRISAERV